MVDRMHGGTSEMHTATTAGTLSREPAESERWLHLIISQDAGWRNNALTGLSVGGDV
jgi:hypothetical protein